MSRLFDELLRVRGFERDFLTPRYEDCADPELLPDMARAVERVRLAVERGEKVLIYGDYDVDGVTASTALHDTLRLVGVKEIEIMLPNRFTDGYGMSAKVVERAKETGVGLVMTVDCGSRNHEIIDELKGLGIDVIVTDHHECGWDSFSGRISSLKSASTQSQGDKPSSFRSSTSPRTSSLITSSQESSGISSEITSSQEDSGISPEMVLLKEESALRQADERPKAVAIVNPKRKDWKEAVLGRVGDAQEKRRVEGNLEDLRELAGVGVVFKLAQALVKAGMIPEGQEKWLLDLVLIGTVCDSMVLRGENRRLCYFGMKVLEKTRRPGLKELMREAGVRRLDTEAIGFQIGPRLNAAGRMETAERALDLLMAKTKMQAASLTLKLEELNKARKSEQRAATKAIVERGVAEDPVIVEQGKWHEGVLGIIAGRLVEEYRRPAFVLGEVDGMLKGSGRSFGDFNLAEALTACKEYIIGGGGHAGACGVKVEKTRLEDFRRAINDYYRSLCLENQEKFLGVHEDLEVRDFEGLSLEFLEEMRKLEPYGEGNAEPVFLLPEVRVVDVARLGADEQHLRLTVWDQNGKSLKLMRFFAPEEMKVAGGETVNVWMTLCENEFRGVRSVEGRILKIA